MTDSQPSRIHCQRACMPEEASLNPGTAPLRLLHSLGHRARPRGLLPSCFLVPQREWAPGSARLGQHFLPVILNSVKCHLPESPPLHLPVGSPCRVWLGIPLPGPG